VQAIDIPRCKFKELPVGNCFEYKRKWYRTMDKSCAYGFYENQVFKLNPETIVKPITITMRLK